MHDQFPFTASENPSLEQYPGGILYTGRFEIDGPPDFEPDDQASLPPDSNSDPRDIIDK